MQDYLEELLEISHSPLMFDFAEDAYGDAEINDYDSDLDECASV